MFENTIKKPKKVKKLYLNKNSIEFLKINNIMIKIKNLIQ